MRKLLFALCLTLMPLLATAAETVIFQFPPTGFPCVFSSGVANSLTYHGTLLYGTTPGDAYLGGACGSAGERGAIFTFDPVANVMTVVATMPLTNTPLDHPSGPLWVDVSNNIFGTSQGSTLSGEGCGTVWELAYNSVTKMYPTTPTIIYTFPGGSGGCAPLAGVIEDSGTNLYVSVSGGGTTT